MPKCINDPNATFKGTEPSPKGLGYCAHGEKNKTVKTGNDGNKWIITVNGNIKKWIKVKIGYKTKNITNLSNIDLLNNLNLLLEETNINTKQLFKIFYETVNEISARHLIILNKVLDSKIQSSKKIGKHIINVDNKIIITDSTYNYKSQLNLKVKVKPGKWHVWFNMWYGNIPNNLIIKHEKYINNTNIKYTFKKNAIRTDNGNITIMNVSDYPKLTESNEQIDWVDNYQIMDMGKNMHRKLHNGYTIKSEYDNGNYNTRYDCGIGKIKGEVVSIIIYFVSM